MDSLLTEDVESWLGLPDFELEEPLDRTTTDVGDKFLDGSLCQSYGPHPEGLSSQADSAYSSLPIADPLAEQLPFPDVDDSVALSNEVPSSVEVPTLQWTPEIDNEDLAQERGSRRSSATATASGVTLCSAASADELSRKHSLAAGTVSVELPESTLITPKSHYEPFEPGAPEVRERHAVTSLLESARASLDPDDDFVEFQLDDFAVYIEHARFGVEMRPLQHLHIAQGSEWFFDGILSYGQERYFVRRVPIAALPVGNYLAMEEHTVRDDIWISSTQNSKKEIYYRLAKPAPEYKRFFQPFLWIADFCKHFVDYIANMWEKGRRICIHDFRSDFREWLTEAHGDAPVFLGWLQQHPSQDYRSAVVANLGILHREAIGVLGEKRTYVHMLWKEIWTLQQYQPPREQRSLDDIPPTVVTAYVKECFEYLPFADMLEVVPLSPLTESLRENVLGKGQLERPHSLHDTAKDVTSAAQDRIRDIQPGDTISTHRDDAESGTQWKREEARDFDDVDRWFALVQQVHVKKHGKRVFDVTWYYRPVDTICGLMKYPWNNELFLSEHCSCSERAKITEEEVLGVHSVDFHGTSTTSAEFFCRQTYIQTERKWVSLEKHHLQCEHRRGSSDLELEYAPGDTVLVHLDTRSRYSEPCEVVSAYLKEGHIDYTFKLRRLLRRQQVQPQTFKGPRNELIYTNQFIETAYDNVVARCLIRCFSVGEAIPAPYNRDGVGGFFYITHEQKADPDGRIVLLETVPASLRQGFDPRIPVPRLRGLDLFCGGGNFGRGLEDGGGIKMEWANDYNDKAIHTYMANVDSPADVHPFLGSIDILSKRAMEGYFSKSVPKVGDVDFISAGSPCPGFSLLTNDKTTKSQRKNQSLVAAFASFVDLYRPKFGLLENVPGIVSRHTRTQDVFSQLICALVGLGYQTHFYFLDASSCGSLQLRSRVFVAFAAPGYKLPDPPQQTHALPELVRISSLGVLPNGEPMATRQNLIATPFEHKTCEEAMGDLPPIHDSKVDACVPFPDHRVPIGLTKLVRSEIYHIPTRPYGMNFAKAWFGEDTRGPAGSGVLTPAERDVFPSSNSNKGPCPWNVSRRSRAFGRIHPKGLISTITTTLNVRDSKSGRSLHWSENRPISIMEARRAQGFQDHEVLLGSPADQFKIVGNSVAREVSVALGVAFREAWIASINGGKEPAPIRATETNDGVKDTELPPQPIPVLDDISSSDPDRDTREASGSQSQSSTSTAPTSYTNSDIQTPQALNTNGKRPASSFVIEIRSPKKPCTTIDTPEETTPLPSPPPPPATTTGETTFAQFRLREFVTVTQSPLGKEVILIDDDNDSDRTTA